MFARSEDGVGGVEAADGGTAGPWRPLVAGRIEAAKIGAAHPLQEIAPDRGHVAQLRRGSLLQGFDDQRLRLGRRRMRGHVGHAGERSDRKTACVQADVAQREAVDVDQPCRPLDLLAHQVDQRRAASDVAPAGKRPGDRFLHAAHGLIGEGSHVWGPIKRARGKWGIGMAALFLGRC
jgi:hypothetical protein